MIVSPVSGGDQLVLELRAGSASDQTSPTSKSQKEPPTGSVASAPSSSKPNKATARNEASMGNGARRDFIVAIDAGHGGDDPGAIGVGKVQEKRVALAIAKELEKLFRQAPGFRGELTRKGDYYLTLRQRTTVARNRRADLFVSIHADAFSGPSARGASVYTLSAKGRDSGNRPLACGKGKRVGSDRRRGRRAVSTIRTRCSRMCCSICRWTPIVRRASRRVRRCWVR